MKRNVLSAGIAGLLGVLPGAHAANRGDEVVVIYNSRLPESKRVALHYAGRRQVPTNQIFGFDLADNEEISRSEFHISLEKPLAKALESNKLWHIGSSLIPATNGQSARVERKVLNSKIRYAVLCYGVPLKIKDDPLLSEEGLDKVRPEFRRNEAAVDSELACLPMIEQKYRLTGPLQNPSFTATNAASIHPSNGILIVARLDGLNADIARGLVDKAMQAERDGLWGRAYFDMRGLTNTLKLGDDWIRTATGISQLSGFETVVDENEGTFSTSFPMDHIAFYAGWYDGEVSGPFSLPSVEFMPGAFAYHIHSYSAATLRSSNQYWCGPLLAKGATVTMGCVAEPYLEFTPDVGVFSGRFLFGGFTFGEAVYAAQNSLSWQITVVGDPLYQPFQKIPPLQHSDLERRQSKLIEWSHLKVVNLNILKHTPLANVASYLEQIETTKQSAVLTEKLADVYAALGKPASAIRSYRKALELATSSQQRVRLRLALGDKLLEQNLEADAIDNYQVFIKEHPDYPDKKSINNKLTILVAKFQAGQNNAHTTNKPTHP